MSIVFLVDVQEHGTSYQPAVIPEKGVFVRALKSVKIKGREYYFVLLQDAYAEQHLLTKLPPSFLPTAAAAAVAKKKKRKTVSLTPAAQDDLPVVIRGAGGLIPSDNYGLLEPFHLPNVVYQTRPGQNSSLIFTVRQTLTNISDHILHQ